MTGDSYWIAEKMLEVAITVFVTVAVMMALSTLGVPPVWVGYGAGFAAAHFLCDFEVTLE